MENVGQFFCRTKDGRQRTKDNAKSSVLKQSSVLNLLKEDIKRKAKDTASHLPPFYILHFPFYPLAYPPPIW